ncbi:MgtC/SapB family protein [Kovacikia minuta CCNUW1]|uniref:MgtC/SapB family protein n=1 Tax=Kovacikia minuta TaxID=2931930 RepID=UPI001CCF09AF|nr:MgtC/SapB family protein [Kovacikia minuta]UBF29458.1 MgtC/SapB family protein [Kovacikia minuta CCNUW1]
MVNTLWLNPSDWLNITLRLILAAVVGGVIGWNRQIKGKAAGLRTHMLVSLGSALFVLIPLLGNPSDGNAISRAIQGVATGIGFLGAGEIIQRSSKSSNNPKVKGLTSAASIWVTAALGMLTACGLWQVSLVGTVLTLLILSGAKWLERFIPSSQDEEE